MKKKNFRTAHTMSAIKATKRPVYHFEPLRVHVGKVSITGRTVKQCMALTKCAKRLSASTPISIRSDVMSVSTGAMTDPTKVVSTAKELAEAIPPSFKFMGISVKAGTVKNAVGGAVILAGVALIVHYGKKWINQKFTKPTNQNSDNIRNGEEEIQPVDQSVNDIRNERTIANFDDGQLVGKLIYQGDEAIIFSEPGTGKTVLTMGIALDIAHGRISKIVPGDDGVHTPQTVFYYDGENDSDDYVKIFGNHVIDTENLHIIRKFYFKDPSPWLKDVRKRLNGVQGDATVILDNISCILSEFKSSIIRGLFLNDFTKIQNDFAPKKVTFIVVAHTNKQKELMGSIQQCNFATTVLKLNKQNDKNLELEVVKNRKYGDMMGKKFMLAKRETEDGFKYDEYVGNNTSQNEGKKSSKADNIPPETIQQMKEFYQKDVPGHGYSSVIKEFELDAKYGIKDSNEVKRIIDA